MTGRGGVQYAAFALKGFSLTVVLFVLMAASNLLLGFGEDLGRSPGAAPSGQGRLALTVLAVCFLETSVLTMLIVFSRWAGWRLVAAVFAVAFGMTAVLTQIESVVFLDQMSLGIVGRVVTANAVTWALFAPVAVWVLGRGKRGFENGEVVQVSRSPSRWTVVLAATGLLHLILYFIFGYYLAWRVPEVAAFYGGEDPGSLWAQVVLTARSGAWFFLFQFARGVLWGVLAVVVASVLAGSRTASALVAATLFGVLVPSQLLLPNPFMPDVVRMAHFVESVGSRALFGLFAVWLLRSTVIKRSPERGTS